MARKRDVYPAENRESAGLTITLMVSKPTKIALMKKAYRGYQKLGPFIKNILFNHLKDDEEWLELLKQETQAYLDELAAHEKELGEIVG